MQPGVVGVVLQFWIEAGDGLAVSRDETLHAVARYQYVIRGDAGLPGIQGLAESDALSSVA